MPESPNNQDKVILFRHEAPERLSTEARRFTNIPLIKPSEKLLADLGKDNTFEAYERFDPEKAMNIARHLVSSHINAEIRQTSEPWPFLLPTLELDYFSFQSKLQIFLEIIYRCCGILLNSDMNQSRPTPKRAEEIVANILASFDRERTNPFGWNSEDGKAFRRLLAKLITRPLEDGSTEKGKGQRNLVMAIMDYIEFRVAKMKIDPDKTQLKAYYQSDLQKIRRDLILLGDPNGDELVFI